MVIDLSYPLIKIKDNLALRKDGTAVALYRIPNTPITVTDVKKKSKHKNLVNRVLLKLKNQKNFQLSLIPKDYLLEEKMRDFSTALADDAFEAGKYYLDKNVTDLTAEMEIPYQYDWLIAIDVRKSLVESSLKSMVFEKVDKVASAGMSLAGYEVPLNETWYEDFLSDEASVYQILRPLKAKRLSDSDTFYYQRMQYLRYIPHLKEEVIANREIVNVMDSVITVIEGGFLKIESAYGISYLDILPIGKLPTIFNGFHIAEFVQRFSFPVELNILGEFIDNSSIKGTMARSNIRYLNIMKEAQSSNTVQQEEIILGNMSLKDLMRKVGKKESLVEFSANLILSASSIASLRKRRQIVLNYFQDLKVGVYEAKFDTAYLFQSTLIGQRLQRTSKFWNHLTLVRGLSELMLFTNTYSGNRIGWYIGRVDNNLNQWDDLPSAVSASKNIVLYNATVGNKEDVEGKQTKNPHFAITGATGEGKSYLSEMIFILTSFEQVKLLYIDPKRSIRKHWEEKIKSSIFRKKYPLLANHISTFNFVTLDSKIESNKGVLDPIVVLLDKFVDEEGQTTYDENNAISTAKNMLFYLLRDEDLTIKQKTVLGDVISMVVRRRVDGEVVGFRTVLDLLVADERSEIADLGEYLVSAVDNSILELAFSYGDVAGLSYDKRVTVLEVADLSLPKSSGNNKDIKLSDHEQKSIVLMFALGAFCRRFGERNRYEDTIEFFDEAWVMMASNEGQEVIDNMKRIGRYYNNVLGLITQSVHDTNSEDDATGFGTLFAFKQPAELGAILDHVGLENNEENLEWISNMISGQCLYKDVYGNLNMITVHTNHKGIDELLKPMKATIASSLENKYAG
ncbi:conjugal transfer protein [Streptococcus minor]|uniref:Conjugal transfer protein n=1 Tax=Streptococcus minor TaxID=229549 RepID=A0A3P1VDJ8_9STRE|nr:ATP-binding protein [Streptococcus minor]RRD31505.1 conjugal transfer protein [Streptococcus minor]